MRRIGGMLLLTHKVGITGGRFASGKRCFYSLRRVRKIVTAIQGWMNLIVSFMRYNVYVSGHEDFISNYID